MLKNENINCDLSASITQLYVFGIITEKERNAARKRLGALPKEKPADESEKIEPVSIHYKFNDVCHCCGALPIDQTTNPWAIFPWLVTLKESGHQRFLIDKSISKDIFSGYKINIHGAIGNGISLTTGSGGRLNLHRSHFVEILPS